MSIDSRTLTNLLHFMADNHEVKVRTGCNLKPLFLRKMLKQRFSFLTEAQVSSILKVLTA